MEDDEFPAKKRFSINGWEPRWGHIGMFLVIVGLLVLTWVVFHRNNMSNNHNGSTIKSPVSSNSTKPKTHSSVSTTPPKSQTSSSSTSKSSSNSQSLTNVGPGNVVGIFAVSTAVGAVGYNIYIRRKISDSGQNT